MNFHVDHIKLDHDDTWFLHGFGPEVDYSLTTELYWQAATYYDQAIIEEFDRLAKAEQEGASLGEALADSAVADPVTTFLAQKMVTLHAALYNYVDDGYSD
jgi:hypothetical protein